VSLFADSLDDVGFVRDYGDLVVVKQWVDALDHRHLNNLFSFNPTSELICQYYAELLADYILDRRGWDNIKLVAISLSETPKTWATYTLDLETYREGE